MSASAASCNRPARRARAWRLLAVGLLVILLLTWLAPVVGADGHREKKREAERDDAREERGGLGGLLQSLLSRDESAAERDREEARDDSDESSSPPVEAPQLRAPAPGGDLAFPSAGESRVSGTAGSIGLGLGGLLLVGVALGLGRLASHPRRRRLAPFEAGRARALRAAPLGAQAALDCIGGARLGAVAEAHAAEAEAWVALRRKRRVPCAEVSGFLAGAFESAWGRDVDVEHVACAGSRRKEACRFRVRALPRSG